MALATAQVGHNSTDLAADPLLERLNETHAGVISRASDLIEAAGRVPDTLDDLTHARAIDFVAKQIRPHVKQVESIRKEEKAPFLDAGRTVDTWGNDLAGRLEAAMRSVVDKIETFDRAKAEAERKRRAEEARRAQEEAARVAAELAAQEAAMATDDDLSAVLQEEKRSLQAQQAAQAAERAAAASAADMARTKTSTGSMITLRTEIDFRVVDPIEAAKVFAHLIDAEAIAKAVRQHIRQEGPNFKKGLEQHGKPMLVCGVEFSLIQKAMIR